MMSGTKVSIAEEPSAIVLTITGPLDAEGGRLVHEATAAAIDADEQRVIEVDLRAAAPLTVDGLRAVARCAAFGRVRFRFGSGTALPGDGDLGTGGPGPARAAPSVA